MQQFDWWRKISRAQIQTGVLKPPPVDRIKTHAHGQILVADQRVASDAKCDDVFTAPFGVDEEMVASRPRGGGGRQ